MIILEERDRVKKEASTTDSVAFIASHVDTLAANFFNRANRGGGTSNRGRWRSGCGHRGSERNNGRSGGHSQHPLWTLPPYPHQQ